MSNPARQAFAAAKINLALVVGPRRDDGLHEIATVMQRVGLRDRITLELAARTEVVGFAGDTLVARALAGLQEATGVGRGWRVRLEKEIPVAAGLGGGSSDAGSALALANESLPEPLTPAGLVALAVGIGSDVPFFLAPGPKLAEGAGETLTPLDLPQDYWVVIALAADAAKPSTAHVYGRYDELGGGPGFAERRQKLLDALRCCRRVTDLAALPGNDLASAAGGSELRAQLVLAGAFRADVSGAGPAVYGLFEARDEARDAAASLPAGTRAWITQPVW